MCQRHDRNVVLEREKKVRPGQYMVLGPYFLSPQPPVAGGEEGELELAERIAVVPPHSSEREDSWNMNREPPTSPPSPLEGV